MNLFRLLVLLAFLLVGLIVGALNSDRLVIDLGVTSIATSSGVAIIVSLLTGVVLGALIVLAVVVIPMYSKLRQANRLVRTATADVKPAAPLQPPLDGV